MNKPTGKLKFALESISNLENKVDELKLDKKRLMESIKGTRACAKSWDETMLGFNEHIEMLESYYASGKKYGFEYAESFEKLN